MRATLALIAPLAVGIALLAGGCPGTGGTGGTGDGNTPTVAAFLPAGVTLDISELPQDSDTDTGQNAATQRNAYERVVRNAATIVYRFHRFADEALARGADIRAAMTDPNQIQVTGTFTINGVQVAFKADFAAFDFNGDGHLEGSGNAHTEPVALRVWADRGSGYQPYFCALVTKRPTTANLGTGSVYAKPSAANAAAPDNVQVFVDYDRTQADHKWNLAYVSGRLHPNYTISNGFARVDVRTNAAGGTEKTVRNSDTFSNNPYGFQTYQGSVHYQVGGTFALLSAQATATTGEVSFTDKCVNLTTRELVTGGQCDSFDTQDMVFLDVPIGGESTFPVAFPTTPTF
jgi:hypothetical protein